MSDHLLICITLIAVTAIITVATTWYYSSNSKRVLSTVQEKYSNLEDLMRLKDREHDRILKSKEDDCIRMADIIRSLMEKQSRFSVDASINSRQESRDNPKG